ncbi:hypothetical protein SAMN03097699_1227 [Flavobacteriaceae bacterium MAR_2010_188]|nr:hypothetical protein SAMN03097699_1227 [Flavobacteriaceae bacterium MAR_2010_188]
MKDKELEDLFKDLQGQFDLDNPNDGHKSRFLDRLKSQDTEVIKQSRFNYRTLFVPISSIAVLLLLFFSLNFFQAESDKNNGLADVSTEMSKTESFFTSAIKENLEKIEGKKNPETQKIISDAMAQMEVLEKDYKSLQKDLKVSGDDQRVIFAMISNFQNRVNLLQNTLEQINQITNINNNNTDEDSNTI